MRPLCSIIVLEHLGPILINKLKHNIMRKAIIVLASSVFFVAAIITTTACQSSAKKVENAQVNLSDAKGDVVLAKQELMLALQDSIQQFRIESERAINNNEKDIFELNAKMAEKKQQRTPITKNGLPNWNKGTAT